MQFQVNKWVKYTGVALAVVTLITVGRMSAPVWALDESAPQLIDKEFEQCITKKVEKRFFNLIEATDDQKEKIQKLISNRQEETRPLREEFRQGVTELSDLMASETADEKQIKDKVHKLRALHEKISDERLETALRVRALMTPEQRKAVGDRVTSLLTGKFRHRALSMIGT